MKFRLLFSAMILMLSVSMTSCKTSLISKFDANILSDIKTGQSMTAKLYEDAIANPDKSFANFFEAYQIVAAHISALRDKEEAREKSKILVAQVQILQVAFAKAKAAHQSKGQLNNESLEQYKQVLDRQWKSLLNTEKNLPK